MFKLIKYEFRKDMTIYIVVFSVLAALELYLAASIGLKSEVNIGIATVLYLLCGWGGITLLMVLGVISYARELGSKYSFMTFMTPNSSYKIVGAKYISLFLATVIATAAYCGFAYADIMLALARYSTLGDFVDLLDEVMELLSIRTLADYIATALALVFSVWLNIIITVSYAYLAITLSFTILANKKGKAILSIGLFVAIRIVTTIITYVLPTFNFGTSFGQILAGSWLEYVFQLLFVVGTYLGVSIMLDKKVSL